jgi:adenosylcobyric acid synthase
VAGASFLSEGISREEDLSAYEIHMGQVERAARAEPAFEIEGRSGRNRRSFDGAVNESGTVLGTMLHGLFENAAIRSSLLGHLRRRRGLVRSEATPIPSREDEYDRLAEVVRLSIDERELYRIVALNRVG